MVTFRIPVRFADLDALRHVNNVRALEFIQEARVDLIHQLGYSYQSDHGGPDLEGVGVLLARIEADYVMPILLEHREVIVESSIGRIGNSSYAMNHVATIPDGSVVIRAVSTLVCVDPATHTSTPIPPRWREALTNLQA